MMQQLMQDLITWINSSTGTIVGVIGIVLAVVFYLKGKERKEFSYCLRSRTLIRKKKAKFEKLSIDYGGKKIDDLCVSNFTIWNSGNKTLNASDMVASKELTITAIDDSRILDVEILKCSEETNKFSTQLLDEHTLKILFDYVDKMEGVVIQIIHTGTNVSLEIDCKIKGGQPVKNYINDRLPRLLVKGLYLSKTKRVFVVCTILMAILLLSVALVATLAVFDKELLTHKIVSFGVTDSNVFRIAMACFLWLYFLFFVTLSVTAMKIKYKIGMPSTLRQYSGLGD